jgi:hypothetical protein
MKQQNSNDLGITRVHCGTPHSLYYFTTTTTTTTTTAAATAAAAAVQGMKRCCKIPVYLVPSLKMHAVIPPLTNISCQHAA